jgi:hypothetical protein
MHVQGWLVRKLLKNHVSEPQSIKSGSGSGSGWMKGSGANSTEYRKIVRATSTVNTYLFQDSPLQVPESTEFLNINIGAVPGTLLFFFYFFYFFYFL